VAPTVKATSFASKNPLLAERERATPVLSSQPGRRHARTGAAQPRPSATQLKTAVAASRAEFEPTGRTGQMVGNQIFFERDVTCVFAAILWQW
jgi:hypothetical protein